MMRDTFDRFKTRERGLFGDNESARPNAEYRSDLVDVICDLRHDDPRKRAIAVSKPDGPASQWIWLPRSLIEFEKLNGHRVRVTLPERVAIEKGLV